ncbi:hypothetical protein H5410_001281 [Solanum commersonii]|uniref:Ubiquitin-like protease family profile domain-containing protein n=1 Tax=Solanum commersonii TaxID=4109 RepID=A0A9J6AYP3_SOLCO|nr:hypothetical protein H5410_001281 [Solanum commersonii]
MLFLKMSIKSLALSKGLVYLLNCLGTSHDVYVPINCNGEFHWVLAVIALKERCIDVYDLMSSSRTNRKLCSEIQKLSTMLPKYLESSGFFEQKDRTNWSAPETYQGKNKSHSFEVIHVTGIAQQASNSLDCGLFVAAYAEFLSDGLQVQFDGIISQTIRMRYASLLWNYQILKARCGYVSNNEDPQRPRPKKAKYKYNASCQNKIVLTNETTDTKIQKRPRTKTCRKKNENSTSTLLEKLAYEAVSSSQVESEFFQKEYKEREGEKAE